MKIIEYEEKYLEDVKDLFVELEEYIISIDEDDLDQLHEEYRDKMAIIALEEVNKSGGKCYLAIQDDKAIGVIVGTIRSYDKYDYLDFKCPKSGEITELVVSKNVRGTGIGKELMTHMENYFKSCGCEFVFVDVFAYNKNAINFYNKNNYHHRMFRDLKKL